MVYREIVQKKKDQIAYLTLDRPDADNAINQTIADEIADCCRKINEDDEVRVVVVTGNGKTFSSGESTDSVINSNAATNAIASLKCPVIAGINGDATGAGLELALACDIRFAADSAHFGFPEVSKGFIPSGGGTQRLPRIVGRGKALEMILTASMIDAKQAWDIGLVNRVFTLDELASAVEDLAHKIASKGPIAERYAKEAISKGMDMTLGQGLGLEADLSFLLQSTRDRAEGISAFLEKRTPEFKGE